MSHTTSLSSPFSHKDSAVPSLFTPRKLHIPPDIIAKHGDFGPILALNKHTWESKFCYTLDFSWDNRATTLTITPRNTQFSEITQEDVDMALFWFQSILKNEDLMTKWSIESSSHPLITAKSNTTMHLTTPISAIMGGLPPRYNHTHLAAQTTPQSDSLTLLSDHQNNFINQNTVNTKSFSEYNPNALTTLTIEVTNNVLGPKLCFLYLIQELSRVNITVLKQNAIVPSQNSEINHHISCNKFQIEILGIKDHINAAVTQFTALQHLFTSPQLFFHDKLHTMTENQENTEIINKIPSFISLTELKQSILSKYHWLITLIEFHSHCTISRSTFTISAQSPTSLKQCETDMKRILEHYSNNNNNNNNNNNTQLHFENNSKQAKINPFQAIQLLYGFNPFSQHHDKHTKQLLVQSIGPQYQIPIKQSLKLQPSKNVPCNENDEIIQDSIQDPIQDSLNNVLYYDLALNESAYTIVSGYQGSYLTAIAAFCDVSVTPSPTQRIFDKTVTKIEKFEKNEMKLINRSHTPKKSKIIKTDQFPTELTPPSPPILPSSAQYIKILRIIGSGPQIQRALHLFNHLQYCEPQMIIYHQNNSNTTNLVQKTEILPKNELLSFFGHQYPHILRLIELRTSTFFKVNLSNYVLYYMGENITENKLKKAGKQCKKSNQLNSTQNTCHLGLKIDEKASNTEKNSISPHEAIHQAQNHLRFAIEQSIYYKNLHFNADIQDIFKYVLHQLLVRLGAIVPHDDTKHNAATDKNSVNLYVSSNTTLYNIYQYKLHHKLVNNKFIKKSHIIHHFKYIPQFNNITHYDLYLVLSLPQIIKNSVHLPVNSKLKDNQDVFCLNLLNLANIGNLRAIIDAVTQEVDMEQKL